MLTQEQIKAMYDAGVEIGKFSTQIAHESGMEPDPDYNFSDLGDHEYVQECAIAVGIAWEGMQPDEDAQEVWRAVREGYLAAIR